MARAASSCAGKTPSAMPGRGSLSRSHGRVWTSSVPMAPQVLRHSLCCRGTDSGFQAEAPSWRYRRDDGRGRRGRVAAAAADGRKEEEGNERLFSALDENLARQPGSFIGCTALVAGTTVGAGVLGLPNEAQTAGFVPFCTATVAIWLYSCITGLLMAEVSLRTLLDKQENSIQTMARRTLGSTGALSASLVYAFLHYAILVAYSSKGGEVLSRELHLPESNQWAGPVLLNLTLGMLVYFATAEQVSNANVALTGGVVMSFACLIASALYGGGFDVNNLFGKGNWGEVFPAIPVIALAFVYQNIVSVVCTSLEGDIKRIRQSIVVGTGIPMVAFNVWDATVLGVVPLEQQDGSQDPLALLTDSSAPFIAPLVSSFQLFAIATSWVGFYFGLKGLYTDTLNLPADSRDLRPFALVLAPPTFFAAVNPGVFNNAIKVAGVFGVLSLFGVLPPAMAWFDRYTQRTQTPLPVKESTLVPGGKPVLLLTAAFAAGVIAQDVLTRIGLL